MGWVTCHRCDGGNVKLRRQITSSGVAQVGWYCLNCEQWALSGGYWLPHDAVRVLCERYGKTPDDIDVVRDYSGDHLCVICGDPAEGHHWAPQALRDQFGTDWDLWPGALLCVKHHRQWHDIVTPGLRGQGALQNDEVMV